MFRSQGFTLLELMIAISIGAILVVVGIPSYFNLIQRNTVTTTSNELLGALLYARSEAIRQEVQATFTPAANGWSVVSGGDTLLTHTVENNHISINGDAITYSPRGRASLAATRSIDISYESTIKSRVCLNLTGRPFIKMAESGACP